MNRTLHPLAVSARNGATRGLAAALLLGALGACNPIVYYQVVQTTTADCVIRFNGEFCDEEEQFPPPSIATWSMEVKENVTLLYTGNETWVTTEVDGQREIFKEERVSRNGCTTTTTKKLVFEATTSRFQGVLDEKVRTQGGEICGDTPFGNRQAYTLDSAPPVASDAGPQ